MMFFFLLIYILIRLPIKNNFVYQQLIYLYTIFIYRFFCLPIMDIFRCQLLRTDDEYVYIFTKKEPLYIPRMNRFMHQLLRADVGHVYESIKKIFIYRY